MNKLLHSLGLVVAIATVGTLAGCDLYFGHDNGGNWSYCGSDGQYQCNAGNCQYVGPTCTNPGSGGTGSTGSGSGSGSGSGYECTSNTDCAAGCYCLNGTCEEGGFCMSNSDCGPGYVCDTTRSSCEPGCAADSDCPSGQYCDSGTSQCTASCTCTSDANAISQGFGWCDNGTCAPGSDPNGSCAGTITCNTATPTCPSGQVPTILNGCWTGNCEAISGCDANPSCAVINDEADCTARTDCQPVYTGTDCTDSSGKACVAGDTGCTCAHFEFASCQSHPQ